MPLGTNSTLIPESVIRHVSLRNVTVPSTSTALQPEDVFRAVQAAKCDRSSGREILLLSNIINTSLYIGVSNNLPLLSKIRLGFTRIRSHDGHRRSWMELAIDWILLAMLVCAGAELRRRRAVPLLFPRVSM